MYCTQIRDTTFPGKLEGRKELYFARVLETLRVSQVLGHESWVGSLYSIYHEEFLFIIRNAGKSGSTNFQKVPASCATVLVKIKLCLLCSLGTRNFTGTTQDLKRMPSGWAGGSMSQRKGSYDTPLRCMPITIARHSGCPPGWNKRRSTHSDLTNSCSNPLCSRQARGAIGQAWRICRASCEWTPS